MYYNHHIIFYGGIYWMFRDSPSDKIWFTIFCIFLSKINNQNSFHYKINFFEEISLKVIKKSNICHIAVGLLAVSK